LSMNDVEKANTTTRLVGLSLLLLFSPAVVDVALEQSCRGQAIKKIHD